MDKKEKAYIANLQHLAFQIEEPDYSSVYLVDKLSEYIDKNESPYIIISLDKAKTFEADAVYFRFFDDGRPPMAQIYIYDEGTSKNSIIFSHCFLGIAN
jgi:hypothetical protein